MSDSPQGTGWWLASDGKWYPPTSRPGRPRLSLSTSEEQSRPPAAPSQPSSTPPAPPTLRYLSKTLTGWVQGLLWASAGLQGLALITLLGLWSAYETYVTRGGSAQLDQWATAEETYSTFGALASLVWIATFVMLIVWWNQAYKATRRFFAESQRWSPGWAVGGWFIPLANLVIPRLVLNEIERTSSPPGPNERPADPLAWRTRPLASIGMVFWVSIVAAIVLNRLAAAFDSLAFNNGELRTPYLLLILSTAAFATGSVTGALFLRQLGRRLAGPSTT